MLLFHHDPLHADGFLDELHATARRRWSELGGDPAVIAMGMESGELEVGPATAPAGLATTA